MVGGLPGIFLCPHLRKNLTMAVLEGKVGRAVKFCDFIKAADMRFPSPDGLGQLVAAIAPAWMLDCRFFLISRHS